MRRIALLVFAGLLAAGAAVAEDFWVKKEYMQWTDAEVRKLLTDSPWAKDITITAPMAALGRGQRTLADSSNATDVENTGGGGRRGRRGGGGASAGGGGSEALVTLNISWRSAQPLRKALVRSRLGAGAAVPAEAEQLIRQDQDGYVIVVTGLPAGMAGMLQDTTLLDRSTIRAGKKPPVAAASMDLQPRTQSVDIIYMFPKTNPILADDKDVEVVLQLGPLNAKKKFNLKDMTLNGKLEL